MSMGASRPQYASASLYVGDLHPDVTESTLYEFFNSVGPVASIRVCRDATTRKSLGYAYVNYNSVADAERSLDTLNFTPIKGVPCRLMWCHRDPTLRRTGNGNLFVKNLDKSLDHKALYDSFSLFGNILSCKVATDETGKSRGFGFVHFESDEAAKLAIDRVNNMKIGSKEVYVGQFVKKQDRVSDKESRVTNLYAKCFPENYSEDELNSLFSTYGQITSCLVTRDKRGRPFGFINFAASDEAKNAIESLHGRFVKNGKILSSEESKALEEKMAKDRMAAASSRDEQLAAADGGGASKNVDSTDEVEAKKSDASVSESIQTLYVQRAQTKTERYSALKLRFDAASNENRRKYEGVNLYVKNLSDKVDDVQLKALFEPFGTITSAKVMLDTNGLSRGFGFVCFTNTDEATAAITDLHMKSMDNKPLYVGLAEKREQRIIRLQQKFRNAGPRLPQPGMATTQPVMQQVSPSNGGMMAAQPGMSAPQYPPMYVAPQQLAPQPHHHHHHHQQQQQQEEQAGANFMWQPPPTGNGGPAGGAGAYTQPAPQVVWKQAGPSMTGGQGGSMMQEGGLGQHMLPPPQQQQQQQQMRQRMPPPSASTTVRSIQGISGPEIHKQLLGEKLYPLIAKYHPNLAGKITGMMLEMENQELMFLLDSEDELKAKIQEAINVLQQAQQQFSRIVS